MKPFKEDVLCIFACLRPLAADQDNLSATKEVSRRYQITLAIWGILSIIGGKWTTYRKMAEDAVDNAILIGAGVPELLNLLMTTTKI